MKIVLKFYTVYNEKRYLAGTLGKDKTFRKRVKTGDKLRLHMAFGLDKSYMDEVFEYGALRIELTVTDAGLVYVIDVATFMKYAFLDDVGKFRNRYYCPLMLWESRPLPAKGVKK